MRFLGFNRNACFTEITQYNHVTTHKNLPQHHQQCRIGVNRRGGGGGFMRCCYCNIAVTSSAMRHKGFGNDVIIDNIHTFITFYIQNYANQ